MTTTYYRIRNKKNGLYLNGYSKEDEIGRFYTSESGARRAVSGFAAGISAISYRLMQRDLQNYEFVPVVLKEKDSTPVPLLVKKNYPDVDPKMMLIERQGDMRDITTTYYVVGDSNKLPQLIGVRGADWANGQYYYRLHAGRLCGHRDGDGKLGDCFAEVLYHPFQEHVSESDLVELLKGAELVTTVDRLRELIPVLEVDLKSHYCSYGHLSS